MTRPGDDTGSACPPRTGLLGLDAVQWEILTQEGRVSVYGSDHGRLQVHKGRWRIGSRPGPAPDLAGLDLDGGEMLGSGVQYRVLLRRRITLLRPGKSRLPLRRSWQRLTGVRHRWVVAFGHLVRTLHDRGLDCRSWSTVFSLREESPAIFLRDPRQLIVAAKPLGKKERLESLARLHAEFWGQASIFQQLRFLHAYDRESSAGRQELLAIGRRALRHLRGRWRRQVSASLGDNFDFFRLQRGDFRIHGRNSTAAWSALGHLLPDPDLFWASARIYKPGSRTHAGSLVIAEQTCFLKRFNDRGWWYRIRHLGLESRAVRTWRASWHCRQAGIPVPQPLLCLEERRYGLLRRSYLLTSFIDHTAPLRDIWPQFSKSEKRNLLAAIGTLVGKMHASGWVHGDLKWDNLLVAAAGKEPILIDWDGSFRPRWRRRQAMEKDLRRFLRDLQRFDGDPAEKAFFLSWWRRWISIG